MVNYVISKSRKAPVPLHTSSSILLKPSLEFILNYFRSLSMNFRVLVCSRNWYMFPQSFRPPSVRNRLNKMVSHLSTAGVSLAELPKSNVFTSKLPSDPALFTYIRPEQTDDPELLGVSLKAMKDLGLKLGEDQTPQFKALVAGNEIWWNEEQGGIYPWAQCYGGQYRHHHA